TYYSIKQSEVRLSKYTIKAPFNGSLTESLINPGTLVRSNQKLGTFIRTGEYEIEASIKAEDRNFISIADQVSISLEGSSTTSLKATVSRINAQVDPTTQTLLVYLNIKSDGVLPGEYVTGTITGRKFENAQKVATKALVRNEMIFVVQNEVAVIRPVNILSTVQDSTIVSGLYPGDLVIDEFRDAAFEGTAVTPILK
ncbi:MAG: HlyD family efflux transporter periplasmic adaptor subunit, partial [Bacteroidota bacterium]